MATETSNDARCILVEEVANGAKLALANAEKLFKEPELLGLVGAFLAPYFLYRISLEECGKIEMLGALGDGVSSEGRERFLANLKKSKNLLAGRELSNREGFALKSARPSPLGEQRSSRKRPPKSA
jgi:hypothetical protein